MTEHKFTDEQIISALEVRMPHDAICREAYDLIKRQSEDIDRLIEINSHNVVAQYEIKAEAIKGFAERLKEELTTGAAVMRMGALYIIDSLVEEMTRRCPNCKHFVGCETACGGVPCDGYTEGDTNG